MKKSKRYISFFLIFVLSFAINFTNVLATGNLKVHFIDVGQADSILVQAPNGRNMLIDAGETKDNAVMNYLNGLGITRLDAVVATHPHENHISEIPEVINNFEIGNSYMPKSLSKIYKFINFFAESNHRRVHFPMLGTGEVYYKNKQKPLIFC